MVRTLCRKCWTLHLLMLRCSDNQITMWALRGLPRRLHFLVWSHSTRSGYNFQPVRRKLSWRTDDEDGKINLVTWQRQQSELLLLQDKINNLIVTTHGESPPNRPLQNVRTGESRKEVPESKEKYALCRKERASYLEMRVRALLHFWPMERDDVLVFLREASSISTGSSRSGSDCGGRS